MFGLVVLYYDQSQKYVPTVIVKGFTLCDEIP